MDGFFFGFLFWFRLFGLQEVGGFVYVNGGVVEGFRVRKDGFGWGFRRFCFFSIMGCLCKLCFC